jgi:hypothetical protein
MKQCIKMSELESGSGSGSNAKSTLTNLVRMFYRIDAYSGGNQEDSYIVNNLSTYRRKMHSRIGLKGTLGMFMNVD